ncbi:hypothetical protein MC885_021139 [Smutsia gigantea]|nr:hypothetical protein MC885_021139 [Smutsia gigantea]
MLQGFWQERKGSVRSATVSHLRSSMTSQMNPSLEGDTTNSTFPSPAQPRESCRRRVKNRFVPTDRILRHEELARAQRREGAPQRPPPESSILEWSRCPRSFKPLAAAGYSLRPPIPALPSRLSAHCASSVRRRRRKSLSRAVCPVESSARPRTRAVAAAFGVSSLSEITNSGNGLGGRIQLSENEENFTGNGEKKCVGSLKGKGALLFGSDPETSAL